MANSKYEYVRNFERDEYLLPNTWIVVRIDGRGFHKFSSHYSFLKPNDTRALNLMNDAASHVFFVVPDICIAYGVSDEYSFVFHRSTNLFERRAAKLTSTVVSTFTAAYVHLWNQHFGSVNNNYIDTEQNPVMLDIGYLPTFDGRAVCYPSVANLRDYLSWRQVDCHINNLYNTTFHALVQQGGMTTTDAEELLKGTIAADKNEILFSRFGLNYNKELAMFRKGSVVYRRYALEPAQEPGIATREESGMKVEEDAMQDLDNVSKTQTEKLRKARQKAKIVAEHVDIIKDDFWSSRPWILSGKPGKPLQDSG